MGDAPRSRCARATPTSRPPTVPNPTGAGTRAAWMFHSVHFPGSFDPHDAAAGGRVLEGRIPEATRKELAARGHKVQVVGDWVNGKVMAVRLDRRHGVMQGAVSPRAQIGYVMGW